MAALLALGKLKDTTVFPFNDLSEDQLGDMIFTRDSVDSFWCELIDPLLARGRLDLVKVIKSKSAEYHRHRAWLEENDWKGVVKRMDRKYLAGGTFKFYKSIRKLFN